MTLNMVGHSASLNSHPQRAHLDIILVPQPSDDARDPLLWSQRKKYVTLTILCLAGFAGTASSVANQLAFAAQGKVYGKTIVEMSYSVSAAIAGIAVGPLIFVPLARYVGRCACIWWSLVAAIACGIWATQMTDQDNYISFILSRLFGGIFGSVPSILGSGTISDIFFLHERGQAFTWFSLSFLLGTVAGPTFGGFVIQHTTWPFEFWWAVGIQALVVVLAFFLLEETCVVQGGLRVFPNTPKDFITQKAATFFLTPQLYPPVSSAELIKCITAPILIGICPVTILAGSFQLVSFGWFVAINTLLTVFLQEPRTMGGYDFSPQTNAAFTFSLWMGIFAAQLYGHYLNDKIPLWLSQRDNGYWKPEYRLHSLWIPGLLVLPLGLGIFGITLGKHLHYMVLALGSFLITFAAILSVPVTVNYTIECFKHNSAECGAIMGFYRLIFGLAIPFFIGPWISRVGVGWVFGMASFFSIASFGLICVLMWKGKAIRQLSIGNLTFTEEGEKVIGQII